jgi:hypothetical protein
MSLSESRCWYSNNCLQFLKVRCSIVLWLLAFASLKLEQIFEECARLEEFQFKTKPTFSFFFVPNLTTRQVFQVSKQL